uniref:GNAT family N-acetyltransferase n=1 Tax=Halomonas sp. TaxID=1486246 RepID=UPI002631E97F|nr:N-acetyltransferase [Halomonas sp.]
MSAQVRPATPADLAALVELENTVFSGDRFSRRQLWHLLNRANAHTLVAEDASGVLGYGTLLMRRGSKTARLYSLGIAPRARGGGLGRRLLEALAADGQALGCTWLSLEVRADNRIALGMYRRFGFRLDSWLDDYYEDGCAAWRMRKALVAQEPKSSLAC